jgi:antirestriction protein ArdC
LKENTVSSHSDIYTRVTESIVTALEQGVRPWLKPWESGKTDSFSGLPRRHCGTTYRGINILLLWSASTERGYAQATWMTFRQALEYGAHIRKGEHGVQVVYCDRINRANSNEQGEDIERTIPFLRTYTVFNVEQIDGLPERFAAAAARPSEPMQLIDRAEAFFQATGATVRHGGDQAFYASVADLIQLPVPEAFRDPESYVAVKAHETIHWTGHARRLDRQFGRQRFGDEGYAREELVAELGAAFLCAMLDITPEPRADHSSYLASWLEVLQGDKRAIFQAASFAQRACDYLVSLQPAQDRSQSVAAA